MLPKKCPFKKVKTGIRGAEIGDSIGQRLVTMEPIIFSRKSNSIYRMGARLSIRHWLASEDIVPNIQLIAVTRKRVQIIGKTRSKEKRARTCVSLPAKPRCSAIWQRSWDEYYKERSGDPALPLQASTEEHRPGMTTALNVRKITSAARVMLAFENLTSARDNPRRNMIILFIKPLRIYQNLHTPLFFYYSHLSKFIKLFLLISREKMNFRFILENLH